MTTQSTPQVSDSPLALRLAALSSMRLVELYARAQRKRWSAMASLIDAELSRRTDIRW